MEEKTIEKKDHIYDCLIIGSGPAGYTAAIYAARASLNPILFTGLQLGGQLTTTSEVENFPGFPDGIDGNLLMTNMEQQARRFGTDIRFNRIVSVEFSKKEGGLHTIETDGGDKLIARTVIIATGSSAKWLEIPSEEKYKGFGVSACATCDGFFFKGKTVAVVGAGDAALEEANYLSKICQKVYLIVRRDVFRASKAMHDRVLSNEKIEILWNSKISEFYGEQGLEGIRLKSTKTEEERKIEMEGVFIAIGHNPNTEVFAEHIELLDSNYIKTKDNTSFTNIPGVFAAGDVADPRYRQAITSAGSGCKAAMDAEKYITEFFQ